MKATEPRDGLYGLLGLCLDVNEGDIAVDYQASLPEVYADVARFCTDKYANINFLCHCRLSSGPPDPDRVAFPSWLPDWANMDEKVRGATFMDERPQAGGGACPRGSTRLSSDRRSLFVRGVQVDDIALATTEPFYDIEPVASVLDRLRAISRVENLAEDEATVHVFARGEGQMIYAERHSERFNVKKGVLERLESLACETPVSLREVAQRAGTLGYDRDDEKWAIRGIVGNLTGRRAARLSSGRWGLLVDADVHPGDEVWVLFGCAYPVILRPVGGGGGEYRVISPMYIHRLMDGEAVERLTDLDAEVHTFGSRKYYISTVQLV